MAWITLKQASNISGKSERTIRYYITQLRKKFGDKYENEYYTYQLQDNGKRSLLVKRSFVSGKKTITDNSNSVASVSKVARQSDEPKKIIVEPGINDIEQLVERRIKLVREMHKEELDRIDNQHKTLLDNLEVGAIRMIDQHNRTTDMLKGQVNRLEQQLIAKDEIMKTLLEDMRTMRLERNEVVSNYIDVADTKPINKEEQVTIDELDDIEDINEEDDKSVQDDIDKAIDSNMSFAEWMKRS